MRDVALPRPWGVVLEPASVAVEQQLRSTRRVDLLVDRPRFRRGHDPASQPLELAVDHESAADLEDVAVETQQPRVLEHGPLAPARIDHDLDPRPVAGLKRADTVEREATIAIPHQRPTR